MTQTRYRLAFLVPWFGPWPVWMPLTWESCRRNPDIDWLIFTDQPRTAGMPENVRLTAITRAEFYAQLFAGLGMEGDTSLPAYKLCDFKPTWGEAFAGALRGYDFWGMCDLDLVWGDLRKFYTDEALAQYDVLNSIRACINGQCTFFRNVPEVNRLYRKIPDVEQLLRRLEWCSVDEMHLDKAALEEEKRTGLRVLRRRLSVSEHGNEWDEWAERLVMEEKGTLEDFPRLAGTCHWENGRVFHTASGTEMAFYHFHYAKKRYARQAWSYPFWPDAMTGWVMEAKRIQMRFKKGHALAAIKYYFLTRLGAPTWHRLKTAAWNGRQQAKKLFPALVPLYRKLKGTA